MTPGGPSEGPLFDRLGAWLAARRLRRYVLAGPRRRVGVLGCGYQATCARGLLDQSERAVLVEVALAEDLHRHPRVQAVEGRLPEALAALPSGCLDLVIISSGLEEVADPQRLLSEARRLLVRDGVALVSACSRRGSRGLELAARLRLTSASRLAPRRRSYDVADLRALLVAAGFRPAAIRCRSRSLGLITFAVCRAD
jgi:SAM-dependent methyltransferase